MRKTCASFFFLLWFALRPATGADRTDEFVRAEMARLQIPGVALRVIQSGAVTKAAHYGVANVELQVPVRAETVFEIGSLTKQFTAACILILAQDGKLSVDDLVSKHLADTPPAWSNITLRHLLTHTSGIKNYTGQSGFELTKRLTQKQFIEALSKLPPDFAPGAQAKYCNSGYNLLGHVIENVSGKSYWNLIAEKIWTPLGMTSCTNRDPFIVVPHRADGYLRKNGALQNRDGDLTDVFSAGAIVSNVDDLVKWNAALDTGRLLNTNSRALMWTAGKLNDGSDCPYGFGWRLNPYQGHKNIGHSGSTSGFSATLQRYPEDELAVIVLCNSDEANIATILSRTIAGFYFREKKTAEK
jgi:CubicO group peptidase (beta-lactamase class C family)